MQKLFSLKKWLTLDEAARHLSIVLGEDVCVADVLRLALDGHLKLSFNFVNHCSAKKGKVMPIEAASFHEMEPFFSDRLPQELFAGHGPVMVMNGMMLDDMRVLELEDQVISLLGIYNLSMLGPECLDVEDMYQTLTNGPKVTMEGMPGVLVCGDGDIMYELQESFDENEFQRGSKAQLLEIQSRIAIQNIAPLRANELLETYQVERETYQAKVKANRDSGRNSDNYYPKGRLPTDGVFVVRTDALRDFELSISDKPRDVEKLLTTTERTSLLLIIAALCKNKLIDPVGRDAVAKIQGFLTSLDVTMDDDTVRKILKKIPDAIERRTRDSG